MPGAEPFLFQGGRLGCLLVHGFTGAPNEMRGLGTCLHEAGHTALGPRLTGHGTDLSDLHRARWQDWVADVIDANHLLQGLCDHVVAIGLSMGGVLSLLLASLEPIDGVVTLSTPYELPPDPRARFARLLSPIIRTYPKVHRRISPPAEGHVSYPAYSMRAIAELDALLRVMRGRLPDVHQPVLSIHSKQDASVAPEAMTRLHRGLVHAADHSMLWLETGKHVVTEDVSREQVEHAILDFIDHLG